MATFVAANPENNRNRLVLELTKMQLQQAQQLASEQEYGDPETLVPAILVALALNYNSRHTAPK